MDPKAPTIQAAIRQEKPFLSRRQEGVVALLLTTEVVRWRFTQLVAAHGDLTLQQYNVLRILRGAGPSGLPTLSIVERMIEHTPGITRLIDRLVKKGLVARARSDEDHRQVLCRITRRGLALLADLDRPMDALDERSLACLTRDELVELIRLLNKVRLHQP
jgi:DNA-binding MarR family transcriptional regulator